ncbi:type II toxin-antitoxin system VapC family toxin [Sphingopyxis indica]|uniref:Ribonuclease VapC n=1 Tax=Sphingopyxis indica TaxID=436663 RepID=A0A239H7E2_9SPHN|nr:type II toxin-antitoxin system VapC family toxin [Sphingopyxis indica]SNS77319.1 ribonuclease VapC [Sphingopyxis indica]
MIVDTSALVAILYEEDGADDLLAALVSEPALMPAPAVLEFLRVAEMRSPDLGKIGRDLLKELCGNGLEILPFDERQAQIAGDANAAYGKGMKDGGVLNLLDLMVYAAAKDRDEPVLCTGRDYASADVGIHPASRSW